MRVVQQRGRSGQRPRAQRAPARPDYRASERGSPAASGDWSERATQLGWVVLPLRAFLGFTFCYAGLSKLVDPAFLDVSNPLSMYATVKAVRGSSPIGGLLGPVEAHPTFFGVAMAIGEFAAGLGVLLGLLTRIAALGGMLIAASLWLTVSWNASPWFTGADLVYLFALSPLAIAGAGGVYSLDGWLAKRSGRGDPSTDRSRRAFVVGGTAVAAAAVVGIASLLRKDPQRGHATYGGPQTRGPASPSGASPSPTSGSSPSPSSSPSSPGGGGTTLIAAAQVPVGGAQQVNDANGNPVFVMQLSSGKFSAVTGICPHAGCTVAFVSPGSGFVCPCHGSTFSSTGALENGPALSGLTNVPVHVVNGNVVSG